MDQFAHIIAFLVRQRETLNKQDIFCTFMSKIYAQYINTEKQINKYFFHKDHLGSSTVMTNHPGGVEIEAAEYLLRYTDPTGHWGRDIH